ncbi:MAG: hypothetical protein ACR2NX_11660 [Chthoniobacterales bacterium]
MKYKKGLIVGVPVFLILIIVASIYFVWPPDFGGRRIVLASAESQAGEQFEVVQFWSSDFYRTQIEQRKRDGSVSVAVIDSDDRKRWSASLMVNEGDSTLSVAVPADSTPLLYSWSRTGFIHRSGNHRVRP